MKRILFCLLATLSGYALVVFALMGSTIFTGTGTFQGIGKVKPGPSFSAWQYLQPNSPGDTIYIPTWTPGPTGQEILYLRFNSGVATNGTTGYWELWSCSGSPNATSNQICTSGSQTCISCLTVFRNAVWGSTSAVATVGESSWINLSGTFYLLISYQDITSTLVGFGLPSGGKSTADPGIGSDHRIAILDVTFTNIFRVTQTTCGFLCGGTAPGYSANGPSSGQGTRAVPINGKNGAWFSYPSADGTRFGYSYTTCVSQIDTTAKCTNIVIGTIIEWVTWSPGVSFPSTAAITNVHQIQIPGTGLDCSGSVCNVIIPPNGHQIMHEMHPWNPVNNNQFLMHTSNLIQTGAVAVVDLSGSGSVTFLTEICPSNTTPPFTNTNLCHWIEHGVWMVDGRGVILASTKDTGSVHGAPNASPVWAGLVPSYATYPPSQELEYFSVFNTNSVGRVKLTAFNNPFSSQFVDAGCYNRYDGVAASPDGQYILAGLEQINAAGTNTGTCTAGKGFTLTLFSF